MTLRRCYFAFIAAILSSTPVLGQHSAHRMPVSLPHGSRKPIKTVAYDAKDKRYYSVKYAKAHHMRDKGGDKLILIPMSKLPKDAKLSRAMKGHLE
jgi:hypothetical protein